ncbi:MAG: T9SS type A sorting domain-containing protein [Bacteroidales bacterium]|nr:T9SS type A sorting domain-containing protein [Bacteroidales bacterium]
MKKIYLSIIALAIMSFTTMAQELVVNGGFETWSQTTNPDSWTYESGTNLTQETSTIHSGLSAMHVELTTQTQGNTDFRQTISVVAGKTYDISFWAYHLDNKSYVSMYVEGESTNSGYVVSSDGNIANQWQEVTYSLTASATGDLAVGLRFYDISANWAGGPSNIIIDDYSVYDPNFTTDPEILISNPADGSYTMNTDVTAEFVVNNFVVATAGNGNGHIHWYIDGAMTMKYDTDPIDLTGLSNGQHQLIMKLVDDSHADLSPSVADTVYFNVASNPMNANIGDIAIIQYRSDAPDGIVIVALNDLPGNSYINFTDCGWQHVEAGVDTFRTGENLLTWFTPEGGVARNTIVSIQDGIGVSLGGFEGALDGISASGDQIFIFNGTLENPTSFVFGISSAGAWVDPTAYPDSTISSNTSYLPAGLVDGQSALHFDPHVDNGYYQITPLVVANANEALLSICDYANNWLTEDDGTSWQENTYWMFNVNVPEVNVNPTEAFYPNPVNDILNVSANKVQSVEILDINGKTVKTLNNIKTDAQINVSDLKQGIYFVKSTNNNGTTVSKLVKL